MKVCFPVEAFASLESAVFGHFGSAPMFVIVDTATGGVETIVNADANHQHGHCNPTRALQNRAADCVVVGGIGRGALSKLQSMGLSVYRASSGSIQENLSLLESGQLAKFGLENVCGGALHGCAH